MKYKNNLLIWIYMTIVTIVFLIITMPLIFIEQLNNPATFPDKLPYDFIQCFCPPEGIVLDIFMGSGTTALAAISLNRKFLGFDISNEYVELSRKRIKEESEIYQSKL